jgi:thiamine biosynthesis lipoprotein
MPNRFRPSSTARVAETLSMSILSTSSAPVTASRVTASPAAGRPRRHRVEQVMGTAIGIDVLDDVGRVGSTDLDAIFAYLRDVEARFSPYLRTSEVSRLARGEVIEEDCSDEVRWVLGLCDDLARTTNGYFDARQHRVDGRLDPSGVVKGWSIDQAAWMLEGRGARSYSINAGGDVVVRGATPWRVGIQHPTRPDHVAAVVELQRGAVATSGAYERGAHIRRPATGTAATTWASVTVVGPDLGLADAYATAAFAMDRRAPAWLGERGDGYRGYFIDASGATCASGFAA